MNIYDRIRYIISYHRITSEQLAEQTGISYSRWITVRRTSGRARAEEIEAICKLFPKYQMWIATGSTTPHQLAPKGTRH